MNRLWFVKAIIVVAMTFLPDSTLANRTSRIPVPFLSQLPDGDETYACAKGRGHNNCGPASLAMVLNYYGKSATVFSLAKQIRLTGPCDGGYTNPFTGTKEGEVLHKENLERVVIRSINEMKKAIDDKYPVVVLLQPVAYRNLKPYANDLDGWFFSKGVKVNHIVVVTGYDSQEVFINDPQRNPVLQKTSAESLKDLPVSWSVFNNATKPLAGSYEIYAMVIKPIVTSTTPQLQLPSNGHTTTDGLWPILTWNSTSTGPFEIRVSKNPNFSDCVVCENVSGKSYRPSGSGADAWMRAKTGTYHWRVRVSGGTWSSGRTFENTINLVNTPTTTRSRTPAPHTPTPPPPTATSVPTASPRPTDADLTMPVLRSPADGAADVSTKAELDWEDVTRGNVNRYEVEVCFETIRGSNSFANCSKYDTNGAESRWKVWDRTGKIFPQRKIRWRVNANDGTKDGPISEWRTFQVRYTKATTLTTSGDTLKLGVDRESNDVTYRCKYNFSGFGSGGSWSSVDSTSFSGNTCSFSINSMRSKGANAGRTIYLIITSDSQKTLGGFEGRENTDGFSGQTFPMP
jgi:uncharacterized protein YvpB